MRAIEARLRRLEAGLVPPRAARLILVEAPAGEHLQERAHAALAAEGIIPRADDLTVTLKLYGDPDGPGRLISAEPMMKR